MIQRMGFSFMRLACASLVILLCAAGSLAQSLSPEVREFVAVDAPAFALLHVRVMDGTGAPAREDQTIVVVNGKIQATGDAAGTQIPAGARAIEKRGYTVIPGLVGMHNHLYYTGSLNRADSGSLRAPGFFLNEIPFTGPRLYLACGVTSMRTTGSVEPYTDENVKKDIDSGKMPGPKIYLTAPDLEGPPGGSMFPQLHDLTGVDDARAMVRFWADSGFTSYKAYMHITRAELQAAAEEAHKRHLKLTAHLCSVGYREAAEAGVDDLEHGFMVDSEFVAAKQPDVCPSGKDIFDALMKLSPSDDAVKQTYRVLIERHVAVTSTLPVFEASTGTRPALQQRVLDAMSPESRISYLTARARAQAGVASRSEALLKKAMELEYGFAKAGGMLLAGPDPTGNGGTLPGFGDQREVELLVEAGFTPEQAIRIATFNGADFMGISGQTGSIAAGKQADLVLINGNPARNIADIEKVETVFKDGVGYDSAKLIDSVRGQVGIR